MRIAIVAPDCNKRDGQARYVSELAEQLAGRHEVHVFSVTFEDTDASRVRHRPVRAPRHATRVRFFVFLLAASRAVARERFDVVHALGASCLTMNVLTAEFCQASWDEALQQSLLRSLAGGPVDALIRRSIAAVERWVFADGSTSVIGVSSRVSQDISRFYGRSETLHVIPNGVDLDTFRPASASEVSDQRRRLGLEARHFMVLFVGEFQRKNLRSVIDAMALTRDPHSVLVAVGGSDPASYAAQAAALGLGERVRLLPITPEPEKLMAAADVFVFPTLYEPFGMAPLEAAACGTPVIVSRQAGFAEWIDGDTNGIVLNDPNDAKAIARCLDRLAADPSEARAMGARGRRLAERFSWSEIARQTETVYRGLVDRHRASAPTRREPVSTSDMNRVRLTCGLSQQEALAP